MKNEEMSQEGKVISKLSDIFSKLSKGYKNMLLTEKKITLWITKSENLHFYKKYLGRMESGAWDRYGDEAEVLENKMNGDPVKILEGRAKEIIVYLTKKIQSTFNQLMNLAEQAESGESLKELKKSVDKYVNERVNLNFVMEESNNKSYAFKISRATSTRLADALLWGGKRKIYGYTTESLVMKKLPPPNHTVASIFVENPEEKPQMQSVKEIFEGPESIKILASSEKTKDFNIFKDINFSAIKSINKERIVLMRTTTRNMKAKMKSSDDEEDKERYEIVSAINKSLKHLLKMQRYSMDCAAVYFDMIIRIDNLARKSVESVLQVEQSYRDKDYSAGIKYAKPKTDNKSKQERRERYNDIKKTAWYLNKGKHVKDDY